MTVAVTMELMETDVTYFFSVEAVNQIGFTSSNEVVSCTTGEYPCYWKGLYRMIVLLLKMFSMGATVCLF